MTSGNAPTPAEVLAAVRDDAESVAELTRRLVKVPSRGGIDDYGPVLDLLSSWLADHGLDPVVLQADTGAPVGLSCVVRGGGSGRCWVLDACVDTAPFGDEDAWTYPPTAGVVHDGWLWGRGSADSKVAAAIFCHIARRVAKVAGDLNGDLVVLLDADEHTGSFGGARAFFQDGPAAGRVGGVMIGYPGIEELVVGSRGVLRVELVVHGVATHSGAKSSGDNAVAKAAELVHVLSGLELPEPMSAAFPVPPKLSVTAIHGGEGYTITPDLCRVNVDVRTTPDVGVDQAFAQLQETIDMVDRRWPNTAPTTSDVVVAWPPYVLAEDQRLRNAVQHSVQQLGLDVATKVSGPSNIGNYLATLGIPATAGFGVNYRGLHAVDERIELSTIPVVQAVYHAAVLDLLT